MTIPSRGFGSPSAGCFERWIRAVLRILRRLAFPMTAFSMQEALKLIGEIELPAETALVIDDYHLISATDVSRFIWFLVVNEIDHLHIVLTARFVERFQIEELSLKGYLHYIEKETFELLPRRDHGIL